MNKLIDRLESTHTLSIEDYAALIADFTAETAKYAAERALRTRQAIYGDGIYIRGLIEIGNVCRNDCLYCGIRRSNKNCERYMLNEDDILDCCRTGYSLGFRTFVLQGGEGAFSAEDICRTVSRIKSEFPDCAITLSFGEYSYNEYLSMYEAGADRYLLRHETACPEHYAKLHPPEMSFENRMRCLYDLRDIGFQVGCGFMVGSPFQTAQSIAADLKFTEEFKPDMCGIGPFIPQHDTPFGNYPAGSTRLTVFLLSLIRLIKPNILLPATTALGTADPFGREKGILAGANVVMPNLSPVEVRKKYALYDNKIFSGSESAQNKADLAERMAAIGCRLLTDRGDIKK